MLRLLLLLHTRRAWVKGGMMSQSRQFLPARRAARLGLQKHELHGEMMSAVDVGEGRRVQLRLRTWELFRQRRRRLDASFGRRDAFPTNRVPTPRPWPLCPSF